MTRENTSKKSRSVPNQCSPLGAPALGKRAPSAADWAKPYGASQGAKIAQTTKTAVSTTPMTSIQRARPDGVGERPGEQLQDPAHQYLTRGSTRALTMSTSRLISTTATAKMVMIPCTAP